MKALAFKSNFQEVPEGRVEMMFDPTKRREVEEAKHLYQQARLQGRFIQVDGKDVESFRPCASGAFTIEPLGSRDLNKITTHVFDETGDRRIMWDVNSPAEVKEAAKLFDEYIKKGWKAYGIHRLDPKARGTRIYSFDADMEEIEFDDRSLAEKLAGLPDVIADMVKNKKEEKRSMVREKLKRFAETFDQVKLLPKTYPG